MLPEKKIANNLNFYRNRRSESQNEYNIATTSRDKICSKEKVSLSPSKSPGRYLILTVYKFYFIKKTLNRKTGHVFPNLLPVYMGKNKVLLKRKIAKWKLVIGPILEIVI